MFETMPFQERLERGNCENSSFTDEDSTSKYSAKDELAMISM